MKLIPSEIPSLFFHVKGINAIGNQITNKKVKEINLLDPLPYKVSKEKVQKKHENKDTYYMHYPIRDIFYL
jgi:hypothetical protein